MGEEAKQTEKLEKKIEELDKSIETLGELLIRHEHHSPISSECEQVLEQGPTCGEGWEAFKKKRKYVMCSAFSALEQGEAKNFSEAIEKGWEKLRRSCGE